MSDDGRGVAMPASRTSATTNRRTRRTDARYVDNSAATEVEVDQQELDRLREEALNTPLINSARKVFEYINRSDIQSERAAQQHEANEERKAIEEDAEVRRASKPKFFNLLTHAANRSALVTLLVMTALMAAVPLSAFYVSSGLLFAGLEDKWRLMYSGFVAVLCVNVLTIGFGLYAYYEPEDPESDEERSARIIADKARADAWVREITRGRMIGRGQLAKDDYDDDDETKEE